MSWSSKALGSKGTGAYASLKLDTKDNPHIAYYASTGPKSLMYIYHDGTSWKSPDTVDTVDKGNHTSLALDASDYAHIAYRDLKSKCLRYATNKTKAWGLTTVATGVKSDQATLTRLALDSDDAVHITYQTKGYSKLLNYATNRSGVWREQQVKGVYGTGQAMTMDTSNTLHSVGLQSIDKGTYSLRYTRYTSSCSSSSGPCSTRRPPAKTSTRSTISSRA